MQTGKGKDARPPHVIGLLASEVCTRGGVQSFMLRIADVIADSLGKGYASKDYCISLNDSCSDLSKHPAMPDTLAVWGAARSKKRLIIHAMLDAPRTDVLFVGHLGLAPVAYLMKKLGRVRRYHVILHGIEAWKRVAVIDRLALRAATNIVATTRFTAEECARHNGLSSKHFRVIPLCADERKIDPSPSFNLHGEFKLLCVARQDARERYKGFEHVFDAIGRLVPAHPRIHLNLVGTGNDQEGLKAEAKKHRVHDQVTFWGVLSDEELAAAYQQCDVFIMPSKKEGFGIVFLEAMRHGKPCIGGNHGGTPDVIEHERSGYLVEYGDVESICRYLSRLEQDKEQRLRLGKRGLELVLGRFSVSAFRHGYKLLMQSDSK
jgi:glycosyltransferase involved in cell wall biosynthesis